MVNKWLMGAGGGNGFLTRVKNSVSAGGASRPGDSPAGGLHGGKDWERIAWRRGRDSNPRYGCPYAAFRVRCIRPLCHLSGAVRAMGFCSASRRASSTRAPASTRSRPVSGRAARRACKAERVLINRKTSPARYAPRPRAFLTYAPRRCRLLRAGGSGERRCKRARHRTAPRPR